jgi:tetratricopeptide (TPR) repeat protein
LILAVTTHDRLTRRTALAPGATASTDPRVAPSPDPVASRIETARALLQAHRAAEALVPAQQAAGMAHGNTEAAALLAEVHTALAAGEPELVKLELKAVLNPDDAGGQLALGEAYAAADRPHDAERCLKQALGLGEARQAHTLLAGLYLSVDMLDAADHHARLALAADDRGAADDALVAMAYQTLASACEARGEHDRAEAFLDQAYGRQSLFRQPTPAARFTTLVLVTRGAGNIDYGALLPQGRFDRTVWYMEHARPEQVGCLGDFALVLNAIGDPDIAEASRPAVDAFLASCDRPVLNPPAKVEATYRHLIGETLAGIPDLVVPHTVRLTAGEIAEQGLASAVQSAGFAGSVIVRPAGSHGGKGMVLARSAAELDAAPTGTDAYLTAFHDYRSADGFYRKYRMIFVGRRPHAYHLAIGPHWMVHHQSARMADDPSRIAEEMSFLQDPGAALGERAMVAIRAIGERLDLDYGGVDFSLTADGQVLLFEANATMLTHLEPADGPFAAKNPFIAPILQAFRDHLTARAQVRSAEG